MSPDGKAINVTNGYSHHRRSLKCVDCEKIGSSITHLIHTLKHINNSKPSFSFRFLNNLMVVVVMFHSQVKLGL